MKDKLLKILKSNIFFAIVTNALILLLCILLTSFSYDDISDFYNSLNISQYHFYYSNEINYILAVIIGSVQYAINNINCFVLALAGLSFVAFTSVTYVFADKFSKIKSLFITVLIAILFSLNHYAGVHSVKTAALLIASGFLLVLNAIRNKRYNLPCWIGVGEILVGSFFKFEYFFVGLGFAIAFFFGEMISKRKYKIKFRKFMWFFRPFLLMFIFITLLVCGAEQYSYSVNNTDAQTSEYYTYSELTEKIDRVVFPNYNDFKESFESANIGKNDYELLKGGYYDSSTVLNNDSLKMVNKIQLEASDKTVWSCLADIFIDMGYNISTMNTNALLQIIFFILVAGFVIIQKKRYIFFPIFYIVVATALSVAIRYFYTAASYYIYGVWLMMFLFLVFSFDFENLRENTVTGFVTKSNTRFIVGGIFVVCLFMTFSLVYQANLPNHRTKSPDSLYSEIGKHPDRLYVLDPIDADDYYRGTENYLKPLWGFRYNAYQNIEDFRFMHNSKALKRYGTHQNIYQLILNEKKVFVIDNNITFKKERYFKQYYNNGNNVSYNLIDTIDGYKIYSVKSK